MYSKGQKGRQRQRRAGSPSARSAAILLPSSYSLKAVAGGATSRAPEDLAPVWHPSDVPLGRLGGAAPSELREWGMAPALATRGATPAHG